MSGWCPKHVCMMPKTCLVRIAPETGLLPLLLPARSPEADTWCFSEAPEMGYRGHYTATWTRTAVGQSAPAHLASLCVHWVCGGRQKKTAQEHKNPTNWHTDTSTPPEKIFIWSTKTLSVELCTEWQPVLPTEVISNSAHKMSKSSHIHRTDNSTVAEVAKH